MSRNCGEGKGSFRGILKISSLIRLLRYVGCFITRTPPTLIISVSYVTPRAKFLSSLQTQNQITRSVSFSYVLQVMTVVSLHNTLHTITQFVCVYIHIQFGIPFLNILDDFERNSQHSSIVFFFTLNVTIFIYNYFTVLKSSNYLFLQLSYNDFLCFRIYYSN